jgi:hypothetical protein
VTVIKEGAPPTVGTLGAVECVLGECGASLVGISFENPKDARSVVAVADQSRGKETTPLMIVRREITGDKCSRLKPQRAIEGMKKVGTRCATFTLDGRIAVETLTQVWEHVEMGHTLEELVYRIALVGPGSKGGAGGWSDSILHEEVGVPMTTAAENTQFCVPLARHQLDAVAGRQPAGAQGARDEARAPLDASWGPAGS